ncbi:MarR family winged helix-turn-helix transcriptional regulator [Aliarcobacter vitoriensis]|uniref:HTH-type transcriptional regulator SarZ n=1 Tax=Aliarcobacter vitoriensis TaxID=2011099 RepID=A0A366MPQ3_9BACT|nr:MarR family transcriptional regulator [Aliarcobacter vitoriensis]RBQ27997.1 MarR family transcriptional regulator [Aliarcobacter vitoriensis]
MDKQYIDSFYDRVKSDEKCEIFSLSLPLFLINKDLTVASEQFLKTNYDLLHTDIDVLASLFFNGEDYTLSPTDLYDGLIFSSGGMTKVLKKLEERKLIKREYISNDKRKKLVCLTQNGVELITEIMDNKACMLEKSFSILTNKEKDDLKKILAKLLYSLNS